LTCVALALLNEWNHPCTIVTKNAMIERDLDILVPVTERNLVHISISINSLDWLRSRSNKRVRRIG